MALTSAEVFFGALLFVSAAEKAVRAGSSFAGPYVMNLKSFANCPKAEVADQIIPLDVNVYSILRHNHTTKLPTFDGNMSMQNDVYTRGATKMALDIAKWDTVSGWREHFLVMPLGELCYVMEEVIGVHLKSIAATANTPTRCPAPNRSYSRNNVDAQLASLGHFPSLPYGRYRVYVKFTFAKPTTGPNVRGCFRIVADVIPKL